MTGEPAPDVAHAPPVAGGIARSAASAFGESLLVSIPGGVLAGLKLPGSIFAWRDLRDAVLPPDLRLALRLVIDQAAVARIRLRFLARPEIFTHGAARAWLDGHIGGVQDHLMLSDGHSLRPIPGLANHLFFYARGRPQAEQALRRLAGVAPELFAALASQVNGRLAVRIGARQVRPPVRLMRLAASPPLGRLLFAPFLFQHGLERSAMLLAEAALPAAEAPPAERPLQLIPLSEAALADAPFVAWLAGQVQRALLGGDTVPVLLLPWLDRPDAEMPQQIAAVLHALHGSMTQLPRMLSWSVRFATEVPSAEAMRGGRITLHPATAFWRLGTGMAEAATLELAGSGNLAPMRDLLAAWWEADVAIRRTSTGMARGPVSTVAVP